MLFRSCKKTAKIYVLFKSSWLGDIIQYDEWPDEAKIGPGAPFIFDDDERFKKYDLEVLGKL